ncbi:hypothetical protein MMC34_003424 [Xylographa carneopallida]|nr:hypothetical protein [Xylographa carneopallida]
MPAERLRSVRIMLLKATHFPCVFAIIIFERGSQYFHRDDSGWDSKSESQLQKQSIFASKISLSRKAKKAALTGRSEASLAQAGSADARPRAAETNDLLDMKQTIAKLSAQVDGLIARYDHDRR